MLVLRCQGHQPDTRADTDTRTISPDFLLAMCCEIPALLLARFFDI